MLPIIWKFFFPACCKWIQIWSGVEEIVASDKAFHFFGDYDKIPGLRSGLPVWKKSSGQVQYLFHDSNYRGWVVRNSFAATAQALESQLTPDCPTKVNTVKNDWWDYANPHKQAWVHDKQHQLHVECFQPGFVNATMKPATADSNNMIDLINWKATWYCFFKYVSIWFSIA